MEKKKTKKEKKKRPREWTGKCGIAGESPVSRSESKEKQRQTDRQQRETER